jgi:thiol-disulfide isomerase/thioredoxin
MKTSLVGTLALLSAMGASVSAQDIGLAIGTQGPSAAVQTLDGKATDLGLYVGKTPVLMEFWATWCPNCQELEPLLKTLNAKYGSRVAFIGVAVSVNQTPERVRAYVDKHELTWTQVFDHRGNASGAYDAPATSYVVVLDRAGKVVYTGLGGRQDLEAAIRKALAGG